MKEYIKKYVTMENLLYIFVFVIFAMICYLVPEASGDDWTFDDWYSGILAYPKYALNHYRTFNGRPFLYYTFAMTGYYFNIWWLLTPTFVVLFIITVKRLLGVNGSGITLLVVMMLLTFSWELNRQVYLYPVGNTAYFLQFITIFMLSVSFYKRKKVWYINLFYMIVFFIVTFNNENLAFALCGMFSIYTLLELFREKKIAWGNVGITIVTVISGLMCVFNPVGQRFEVTMAKVDIPYNQMVWENIKTIVGYLYDKDAIIFLIYFVVSIIAIRNKKINIQIGTINLNNFFCIVFGVEIFVLLFNIITKYLGIMLEVHELLFKEDWVVIVWIGLTCLAVVPIMFFDCEKYLKNILLAYSVLAYASAGIMIFLPEVSHRTMFYALMIIIVMTALLVSTLPQKKWAYYVMIICIVLSFENFMYKLVPIHKVTKQREAILMQYHIDRALYGKKTDKIVLPAYPNDVITFSNDNCNPDKNINEYAYQALKNEYNIPDDVDIVIDYGN